MKVLIECRLSRRDPDGREQPERLVLRSEVLVD